MTSLIISPPRVYEVNGQATPVLSAQFISAVGNDRQIVAAISGEIIRFMGFMAHSDSTTAISGIRFKNGAGGADRTHSIILPPYTLPVLRPQLEIIDSGYFETSVGVGLFADIGTTQALGTVFYIVYKP